MNNKEKLIKQLKENKLMETYEQIGAYENAVDNIFDESDSTCIYSLIYGFDDKTENHEVMFSNLHGIEYFSKKIGLEKYIEIIIPLLKILQDNAYDWSKTFYLRILNSESAFNLLLKKIESFQNTDKKIIKKITKDLVKKDSNKFKIKGDQILDLLK